MPKRSLAYLAWECVNSRILQSPNVKPISYSPEEEDTSSQNEFRRDIDPCLDMEACVVVNELNVNASNDMDYSSLHDQFLPLSSQMNSENKSSCSAVVTLCRRTQSMRFIERIGGGVSLIDRISPCSPISVKATSTFCIPNEHKKVKHLTKSLSMSCLSVNLSEEDERDAAVASECYGRSSRVYSPLRIEHARSRSYLHGSLGTRLTMLGIEELERLLPQRILRFFVGTWNMNGKTPPRHLSDFLLPCDIDFVPDVLIVATQETFFERFEWEVRLQDTLGPSHVLFYSSGLGMLYVTIFMRRELIWFCSIPEVDSYNVHPGTSFTTKGAIAVAFLFFGTSILVINSHLTAHQENFLDRVRDIKKIQATLHLPRLLPIKRNHTDMTNNFDCVFWVGDLNFRLEQPREAIIKEVKLDHSSVILDFDQLNYLRRVGNIFSGFNEADINFLPTYKYDLGTSDFDTSVKQRTPSYTDRILFKYHSSCQVKTLHYDSVQDVLTSDHKPVWGMWEITIKSGRDNIPLSGGLFNREVYLEGLKRRVETFQPSNLRSDKVCVVL